MIILLMIANRKDALKEQQLKQKKTKQFGIFPMIDG
jgi:hypothetical protein